MKQKKSEKYISQLITEDTELNIELKKIKKLLHSRKIDEKGMFLTFKKLLKRYPANPAILKYFLDFLQLLNDDQLIKQFSLKDISRCYKRLAATNIYDVGLNIGFFCFMYNVLDREEDSINLYKSYKQKILACFKDFEERIEN